MIDYSVLEFEIANLKANLSFREYVLKEAKQVGFLYHFTTLTNVTKIVKENKLKKGKEGYISLTRDFQLPNEKGYFNTGEYVIRIVIDSNKLFENTKIKPVKDILYNDEREEGVISDIDLKYITSIDFLTSDTRVFSKESILSVYDNLKFKNKRIVKKFQPVKGK